MELFNTDPPLFMSASEGAEYISEKLVKADRSVLLVLDCMTRQGAAAASAVNAAALNFATRPENMGASARTEIVSDNPAETTESGPLNEDPAPDPAAGNIEVDPEDVPIVDDGETTGEGENSEAGETAEPAADSPTTGESGEGTPEGDTGTDPEPGA